MTRVLEKLQKGHTRADFVRGGGPVREAGLALAPTFVAFTPWTTVEGYIELLRGDRAARSRRAMSHRFSSRFGCSSPRSRSCSNCPNSRAWWRRSIRESLTWPWRHADPAWTRSRRRSCGLQVCERLVLRHLPRLTETALRCAPGDRHHRGQTPIRGSTQPLTPPYMTEELVLLRRTWTRADRPGMKRVLLLSTTTGYQIRSFGEAAERLGVRLVFASDRCDQLEDPWSDHAIPVRFWDEAHSLDAILVRRAGRPDPRHHRRRRSSDDPRRTGRAGARASR